MGFLPDRSLVSSLISRLLDKGYQDAAQPVLNAIIQNGRTGRLGARLNDLDSEAARLAEQGLRLTADNAVFRAVMSELDDVLRADVALLNGAASTIQETGINAAGPITRQLTLPGFTEQAARMMGVQWTTPNAEAVAQIVDYTARVEWAAKLERFGEGIPQMVRNLALRGSAESWGAQRLAREIRNAVQGLPSSYANQLARTLQVTAFRDAQVAHRVANADLLDYQIRIAALDDRTCMACVALHGTKLPLETRVDDHWNGRCTSVSVVRGRNDVSVRTGEDWFSAQSPTRQQSMMGAAAFEAWQAGDVQMQDFVHHTTDDLFGAMVTESSLKGMLGDAAQQYYKAGQ